MLTIKVISIKLKNNMDSDRYPRVGRLPSAISEPNVRRIQLGLQPTKTQSANQLGFFPIQIHRKQDSNENKTNTNTTHCLSKSECRCHAIWCTRRYRKHVRHQTFALLLPAPTGVCHINKGIRDLNKNYKDGL